MKRRRLLIALVVVVGCGGSGKPSSGSMQLTEPGAQAPGLASMAPYVSPGEVISYRLSVLGVEIGAFTIAVGSFADVQGRSTVEVQAGVQSTGIAAMFKQVRTEFASWVDARTGRPVVGRVVETAGKDDPTIETTEARFHAIHDRLLPIAMVAADGATEKVEEQTLAGDVAWDVPSILMYLRGWGAEVGTEMTAQVLRSRYVWQGQFRVAGREVKATELGALPTVRIDGLSRRIQRDGAWEPGNDVRQFSLWITDDADRVPVLVVAKTDFGDVKMEIVGYTPGVGPLRQDLVGASGAGDTPAQ